MTESKLLLLGCGILKNEICYLTEKNGWAIDTLFVDSALHIDFELLEMSLRSALSKHSELDIIVFYGTCHPLIDTIIQNAGAIRTEGQNCVEMLLGHDLFTLELSRGAYFLLEDWARRWNIITIKTFGDDGNIMREIFQGDRKYLLCLRTPCSGDFGAEVEDARRKVGLPVRWMDVSLDHLEYVLQAAITQKTRHQQCPR